MRIPITDVPIEVRRLAAQHLESLRGTELLAASTDAHLDAFAVPLYRPDINETAYYEFTVVGRSEDQQRAVTIETPLYSTTLGPKDSKARRRIKDRAALEIAPSDRAIGFIVVSNGRHDFPVSHWSFDRLPPSYQVATKHTDNGKDEPVELKLARLYKLDALAYAAEDENGELISQSGQMPGLIVGLPYSLDKFGGQIASATANPLNAQATDVEGQSAQHEVKRSQHEIPELKLNDENDWKSFKERYADSFGPLLEHLRKRAARTWELEDLISKLGEGLIAGTTHRVALLGEAVIEMRGPGTEHVRPKIEENVAGPPSLVFYVADVRLQQEVDFDVLIKYGNGESEKLRFFVVSRNVPSNIKAEQSLHKENLEAES
jgi:hypothetical protein